MADSYKGFKKVAAYFGGAILNDLYRRGIGVHDHWARLKLARPLDVYTLTPQRVH